MSPVKDLLRAVERGRRRAERKAKRQDHCKDCPEEAYWPDCDPDFPCPYMMQDDD